MLGHKLLALILILLLLLCSLPAPSSFAISLAAAEPALAAKSAILLHADSLSVLYEKDAHRRMYPASITKVVTALLALEHGHLKDEVQVGPEVGFTPEDGSLIELKPGDKISVKDLLYGMMLYSGNDAAYALAVYIGRRVAGDARLDERLAVEKFIGLMNDKVRSIGAQETHFANPDGYHDPNHWTTAYDLALLARAAMQNQQLRKIVQCQSFEPTSWRPAGKTVQWQNGNRLLEQDGNYQLAGATGLKPGYTPQAGYCLAATASRDGLNLISIVLKSGNKGRWKDSQKLIEYGFDAYECTQVAQVGKPLATASVGRPLVSKAQVVPAKDVCLAVPKGASDRIERDLQWLEAAVAQQSGDSLRLKVPARRSLVVGKASFSLDGKRLAEVDLILGSFQAGWLRYALVVGAWGFLTSLVGIWWGRRRRRR